MTNKTQTIEDIMKEFDELMTGIPIRTAHYTDIKNFIKKKLQTAVEQERERILKSLSEIDLADIIYEVLGSGHHYSTMPVANGILSKLKEAITNINK